VGWGWCAKHTGAVCLALTKPWYNTLMTEEPTLKLYALAVAALRTADNQTAIGIQSVVALLPEGIAVSEAGLQVARDIFPVAEGWGGHHVNATEITQGFPLDPYRLIWRPERVG
jgi:hypothetical protein